MTSYLVPEHHQMTQQIQLIFIFRHNLKHLIPVQRRVGVKFVCYLAWSATGTI